MRWCKYCGKQCGGSSKIKCGISIQSNSSTSGYTQMNQKVESRRDVCVAVVVQSLSCLWLFEIPWTIACQTFLSCTVFQSLLKFMSSELVILSNHLIFCRPLLLLPSVFPSIRIFSNESPLHIRWPNYCSFSISPSNEHSELIAHNSQKVQKIQIFITGWVDKPNVLYTYNEIYFNSKKEWNSDICRNT